MLFNQWTSDATLWVKEAKGTWSSGVIKEGLWEGMTDAASVFATTVHLAGVRAVVTILEKPTSNPAIYVSG